MRGLYDIARLMIDSRRSPDDIGRLQANRLRLLVHHAYEEVPYYRGLFDSIGVRPDDIRGPDDLQKVPVTGKDRYRRIALEERFARGVSPSKCSRVTTSGSTGMPMEIYFTKSDLSTLAMTWVRAMLAHGVRPRERRLQIIGPHNIRKKRVWYERLGFWMARGVSALGGPDDWIAAWRDCSPTVLWGYSGSLKLLARHILRNRVTDVRPRLVFGVSDTVDPECRELVSEAFGKRLIDLYGAAEAGLIAWECPSCDGYHVDSDTLVVELLDGSTAADAQGSIVVTNLYSRAMPFLRYGIGDIGVPSALKPCCGRGLPLMASVEGRDDDCIVLPSGRRLSPMFAFCTMKPVPGVEMFRVHQRKDGHLQILVVRATDCPSDVGEQIRRRWLECLGEELSLGVAFVESLPPIPSGKSRCTISEVPR